MGGCATKPKVLKGDGADQAKPPEAPKEKEDFVDDDNKAVQEEAHVVQDDDDIANKRPSLSSLFHQNEDVKKVHTEDEKALVEETATRETSESQKDSADSRLHDVETVIKEESPEAQEKGNSEGEKRAQDQETNSSEVIKEECEEVEEKGDSEETDSNEEIKSKEVTIKEVEEKGTEESKSNEATMVKEGSSGERQNREETEPERVSEENAAPAGAGESESNIERDKVEKPTETENPSAEETTEKVIEVVEAVQESEKKLTEEEAK